MTCQDAYNKNQFCDFCKQIYYDGNSEVTDGKEWVVCDQCEKWNHVDCVIHESTDPKIKEKLADDGYKYFCLTCTKNKKNSSLNSRVYDESESSVDEQNGNEEVKEVKQAQISEETVSPFTLSTGNGDITQQDCKAQGDS